MIPILIGAAVGAAIGGASTRNRSKKEQKQIQQQQAMAQEAHGYGRAYNEGMWDLQRGQALEALGIQKNRLAQAFQADLAGFNLGLEGQALQNQEAQFSLADGKGMALAAQGASGVKGSGALAQRIEFQENQLARQLDLQGRGNSLAMRNMAQQYSNTFDDIGREVGSWNPGGYRYEAKSLSDVYEANMHGLQARGYDQAVDNAKATGLDYLTGVFGGAASGANLGGMAGGMVNQLQAGRAVGAPVDTSGGQAGTPLPASLGFSFGFGLPGAAQVAAPAAAAITGPAWNQGGFWEAPREWGQSMGYGLDKNNFFFNPNNNSWTLWENSNVRLMGSGAR